MTHIEFHMLKQWIDLRFELEGCTNETDKIKLQIELNEVSEDIHAEIQRLQRYPAST